MDEKKKNRTGIVARRKYYLKHRDECIARQIKYNKKNKEKIDAYAEKNKERISEYNRQHHQFTKESARDRTRLLKMLPVNEVLKEIGYLKE